MKLVNQIIILLDIGKLKKPLFMKCYVIEKIFKYLGRLFNDTHNLLHLCTDNEESLIELT